MQLEPIEKGEPCWMVRRLENAILASVTRATTPQTCWNVFQKIGRGVTSDGNIIGIKMNHLCEDGHLKRVGFDDDGDSQYELN